MQRTFVFAPYFATGGVEALHQLAQLVAGAEMIYWPPLYPEYAKPLELPAASRVVVPEIWPELAEQLHGQGHLIYFWRLGAMVPWTRLHQGIVHLACGEYAAAMCRRGGIEPLSVSDYINRLHHAKVPNKARDPLVVYGSRSAALVEGLKLSEFFPGLTFQRIEGLKSPQIATLFRRARAYLDVQQGGMPGRDRLPREAALGGCVPVILHEGAATTSDVPHIRTFTRDKIVDGLREALERGTLSGMREYIDWIRSAEDRFRAEVAAVFDTPLTVVIPTLTKEGAQRAEKLVEALLCGTRPPTRIFVIDNGGHCSSWGIRSDMAGMLSEVFSPGRNIGVGPAFNVAVERFPEDNLVFLGDDVRISKGTIAALADRAARSTAVFIGCELDAGWPCCLIKPEAFKTIGSFDGFFAPAYGEDNDFTYRLQLAKLGYERVHAGVSEPHAGSSTRESGGSREQMIERATIRYVAKWGGKPFQEKLTTPVVSDLEPEVFIATVPWRRAQLERVLATLVRDPPKRVSLFLDGWANEKDPSPVVLAELAARCDVVIVERTPVCRGPGMKWLYAAERDVLGLFIDDDMDLAPNYVSRSLAAWMRLREPFAWAGGGLSWGMPAHYARPSTSDVRLTCISGGTACIPTKLLRGLASDPDRELYFAPRGHDEALVAYHLRSHRIWRPEGPAVASDTDASFDPRSQWGQRDKKHIWELEARLLARGWPIPDSPLSSPVPAPLPPIQQRRQRRT